MSEDRFIEAKKAFSAQMVGLVGSLKLFTSELREKKLRTSAIEMYGY